MEKEVVLTLLTILFLVSCVAPAKDLGNITIEVAEKPGECKDDWICISSSVRAFQSYDCEIINRTTCETECVNGVCQEKEIKICTSGFKCRNQYSKGFQREDCSWEKTERCEFGCDLKNNKCHTASTENITEPTNSEKPTPHLEISFVETHQINNQNLTIYILEAEKVRLKINEQRSDWLNEGETFTSSSGTQITIIEILFQPYEGGNRKIIYKVD